MRVAHLVITAQVTLAAGVALSPPAEASQEPTLTGSARAVPPFERVFRPVPDADRRGAFARLFEPPAPPVRPAIVEPDPRRVICGMLVTEVSPSLDPGFAIGEAAGDEGAGPRFHIRNLAPPICDVK